MHAGYFFNIKIVKKFMSQRINPSDEQNSNAEIRARHKIKTNIMCHSELKINIESLKTLKTNNRVKYSREFGGRLMNQLVG